MNSKRTLLLVLISSIAINLLLAGGVAGHFFSHRGMQGPPPTHQPGIGRLLRGLDDETQEKLGGMIRKHRRDGRRHRKEMRRAQHEFEEAILSEPFDEARVKLVIDQLQNVTEAFQVQMHEQMITVMKRLTPEERRRAIRGSHQRHINHRSLHRDREP